MNGNYWNSGKNSSPSLDEISEYLDEGKKVVALVKIDGNDKDFGPLRYNGKTGHWVSIQDVDLLTQKVQIYNPFNDQEQIYSWNNFKDAWKDEGSHTVYNYAAVIANPPVIPTEMPTIFPAPTFTSTPSTISTIQPISTNIPTVTPPVQQPASSQPSIWEKIWNWLKGLGGK